ncbi:MAG: endonuclease III [Bacteroidota bacterium]
MGHAVLEAPTLPETPRLTRKERAAVVLERLREAIPAPETELAYRDPFELLVAVVLSAQCTDARVNIVTPDLFEAFPTPQALHEATPEEIFPLIKSISYPNNKSKHLSGLGTMLVEDFGSEVPASMDDLVKLPGVGRKTAQVVASVAFDIQAFAVDTHVFRVTNRIGIAKDAPTPLAVEKQAKALIPREHWGEAHHLFILHGRYTCTARKPKCTSCVLTDVCDYYSDLEKLPRPLLDLDEKAGRYYCKTCRRYAASTKKKIDRYGTEQRCCRYCGSMNVFTTKDGWTTKVVRDYRI